jgi:hypothetical protein
MGSVMRMSSWIAAVACGLSALAAPAARAGTADVIAATYNDYSLVAPTPQRVVVCHGFGCKYRAEIDLSAADRAKLTQIMAGGKSSPAAERQAVAGAWAWFDRRIASDTGTRNHVAAAGAAYMFDANQFDCVDSSRNTTSLLLVLDQLGLLRFHTVDVPKSRGAFIDGRPFHYTAVLREKANGVKWAVDSWTRSYGQPAEVMTLEHWLAS